MYPKAYLKSTLSYVVCVARPMRSSPVLAARAWVQFGSQADPVGWGQDEKKLERRWQSVAVEKAMASSSLAEVVDRILDKGVVVDAWVRVSLVGIEILAIEARVVVAGVDTYLKYAEAVGLTAAAA